MVALSIDTAANLCAVAVHSSTDGDLLSSISQDIGRGHAEILMQTIADALEQASAQYSDIEKVISSIGPGSFTGVRIGLAAARAIGLGCSVPVVGVSVLEACAAVCDLTGTEDALVSVLIDARRNEYYFQAFQDGKPVTEPALLGPDDVGKFYRKSDHKLHLICGSGIDPAREIIDDSLDAKHVILGHKLATAPIEFFAEIGLGKGESDLRPEPLYLRNADAKSQQGFAVERKLIADHDTMT